MTIEELRQLIVEENTELKRVPQYLIDACTPVLYKNKWWLIKFPEINYNNEDVKWKKK